MRDRHPHPLNPTFGRPRTKLDTCGMGATVSTLRESCYDRTRVQRAKATGRKTVEEALRETRLRVLAGIRNAGVSLRQDGANAGPVPLQPKGVLENCNLNGKTTRRSALRSQSLLAARPSFGLSAPVCRLPYRQDPLSTSLPSIFAPSSQVPSLPIHAGIESLFIVSHL